ncbi:MAG: OmpA family protein [Flavobacteriales bacterium]|nr:OmpA family protein [Flavobacteriales bacterium]MDG1780254.1 OmpA family protein [Flavobacteriales bacterium]MDG2246067.1 OmpA family protein [Flavobacteriales bacterium]
MLFKRILLAVGFIGTAFATQAQLKRAEQAFEHHHYEEAIELFNQAIRKDLDNDEAITKMAICYWKTNQLPEAEYWFTRAALMNDDVEVKLQYSQVLIANEKYELAVKWLDKYMAVQTNEDKLHYANQLHAWAGALANGAFQEKDCKVQPVALNSKELDFAPVHFGEKLYFITNRKGVEHKSGEYDPWTNGRFTDVFYAMVNEDGTVSEPLPSPDIPLGPYHEGPICFSPDGKELYMTTSDIDDNKRYYDDFNNTRVKVVRLRKNSDGMWKRTTDLSFYSSDYNTAHPAVSPDGKMLVYASDKPGGQGKMDLYYCKRNSTGGWGKSTPFGAHINTNGNEVFPSFDKDGTLYFSSNHHAGFGGMDIFQIQREGDNWSLPKNMGKPINSARDDFGITFGEDNNSGYFTSNRNTGNKDDVLYFKRTYGIRIEGQVIDCASQEPIENVQVELTGKDYYRDFAFTNGEGWFSFVVQSQGDFELTAFHDRFITDEGCTGTAHCNTFGLKEGQKTTLNLALSPEPAAQITASYLCGNVKHGKYGNPLSEVDVHLVAPDGEVVSIQTAGLGSFYMLASEGETYELIVNKKAFNEFRVPLEIAIADDQCHSVEVMLEPDLLSIPPPLTLDVKVEKGMILELYHIYFDSNASEVRDDATPDLETFYELLIKYPSIKGEVMAHTDSKASFDYNMQLSQERANNVMAYLVGRGIDPSRLQAVGYGETKLINHCSDGKECTEEQHQRNRRVEFRVIDVDETLDFISQEDTKYEE